MLLHAAALPGTAAESQTENSLVLVKKMMTGASLFQLQEGPNEEVQLLPELPPQQMEWMPRWGISRWPLPVRSLPQQARRQKLVVVALLSVADQTLHPHPPNCSSLLTVTPSLVLLDGSK